MCGPNIIEADEQTPAIGHVTPAVGVGGVRIFKNSNFIVVHTGAKALYINVQQVNDNGNYSDILSIAFNTLDAEYFAEKYGEWVAPDDIDTDQELLAAEFPVDTRVEVQSCGGNVIGLATVTGVGNSTDVKGDAADVVLVRLDKPARFGPDGFYSAFNITAPPHMLRKIAVTTAPD